MINKNYYAASFFPSVCLSHRVRHLCVDLSSNAGRCYIQVDVVLLVQAQVAVTHQVQCVDAPAARRSMDRQLEQKYGYTG